MSEYTECRWCKRHFKRKQGESILCPICDQQRQKNSTKRLKRRSKRKKKG